MDFKFDISKGEEVLLKVAAISAAVVGIATAWSFYKNNVWHPKVEVQEVDFNKGVATLLINKKPFVLRGDSVYLIGYDWGVRFGIQTLPQGKKVYDRIEVLKRQMVHQVIRKAADGNIKSFTGSEDAIVNGVWGVKKDTAFDVFEDKKGFVGNEETFWDDAFFGDKGGFSTNVGVK
jgi:hypothetical protein